MSMSSANTVPVPFSVAPTWAWDGDDGSWSTFSLSVGTPPQTFRVLPSTTGAEVWVPLPQGCEGILQNVANCSSMRGVDDFDGQQSLGFQSNASSTWDLIGIYELATEQNLWGANDDQGFYGSDCVLLGKQSGGNGPNLTDQTVAGVATADVWLGSLGLGPATANFSVEKENIPSLLDSMKTQNATPSLSFGYTAGASYASPQSFGNLILGGYDRARFTASNISFPIGGPKNNTLPVNVESIVAQNAFGGTLSLSSGTSISTIIDSTVSQMWFPQSVCDLFAQAFGLKYDSSTQLYIVNSTTHKQLLQMNPTVTFTVSGSGSDSATTNIVMPYAAFDLQAGIPIYNFSTNYFPIRVAANESQYVLGRAFLQEAYIFVDWERTNFTIGQAIHQNSTTDIVPVLSPSYSSSGQEQSSGLSTGAIVGIAVGVAAVLVIAIGLAAFFIIRSRRKRKADIAAHVGKDANYAEDTKAFELHDQPLRPDNEAMSSQVYEMQTDGENSKHELGGHQRSELPAESLERELEGEGIDQKEKKSNDVYELP